jgi:hypothetical protein
MKSIICSSCRGAFTAHESDKCNMCRPIDACSGGGCWEGCPHSISGKAWNEGFRAAIKKAAYICDAMVIGGRAWTEGQAIAADALFAASKNIRTLGEVQNPLEELKKENNSR